MHGFMRAEWMGGGTEEISSGQWTQFVLTWVFGWWVLFPLNLLGVCLVACCPPFAVWYSRAYDKLGLTMPVQIYRKTGAPCHSNAI